MWKSFVTLLQWAVENLCALLKTLHCSLDLRLEEYNTFNLKVLDEWDFVLYKQINKLK